MIPAIVKNTIFDSIPKTLELDYDTLNVKVDYQENVEEPHTIDNLPTVMLYYYGDAIRARETSQNYVTSIETVDDGSINKTFAVVRQVTLGLHCMVVDIDTYSRYDLISTLVENLEKWALFTLNEELEQYNVSVRGITTVQNNSNNTDRSTQHTTVDVSLVYSQSEIANSQTIESIEFSLNS